MHFKETILAVRSTLAVDGNQPSEPTINLLIALLALLVVGMLLVAVLLVLRRMKQQQQMRNQTLPRYNDVVGGGGSKRNGNHRRLTIQTGEGRHSVVVFNRDGQPMLANPQSPPHSPDNVPEIHITFPDEHDDQGRPKSGRVVVVRVGETAVGMEPLPEEQLPAYEKESSSQFYSIDMEKIGGLKEKERHDFR